MVHFVLLSLLVFFLTSPISASLVKINAKTVKRGHRSQLRNGITPRSIELKNEEKVWRLSFTFDEPVHRKYFIKYLNTHSIPVSLNAQEIVEVSNWYSFTDHSIQLRENTYHTAFLSMKKTNPKWVDLIEFLDKQLDMPDAILIEMGFFERIVHLRCGEF